MGAAPEFLEFSAGGAAERCLGQCFIPVTSSNTSSLRGMKVDGWMDSIQQLSKVSSSLVAFW